MSLSQTEALTPIRTKLWNAHWLPLPQEGFRFTARFYSLYRPLIDGSFNMPGVVRVG